MPDRYHPKRTQDSKSNPPIPPPSPPSPVAPSSAAVDFFAEILTVFANEGFQIQVIEVDSVGRAQTNGVNLHDDSSEPMNMDETEN